jgi:hypothetical protein
MEGLLLAIGAGHWGLKRRQTVLWSLLVNIVTVPVFSMWLYNAWMGLMEGGGYKGNNAWLTAFVIGELGVVASEMLAYYHLLSRLTQKPPQNRLVLALKMSVAANAVSAAATFFVPLY